MTILATREEIKKAVPLLELKWAVQNDNSDNETRFIYFCQRLDQIVSLAHSNNADLGYAVHRWYNFQCSKQVENIFCEFGAIHYPEEKDHDIDLTIDNIPFDIKLSVVSAQYEGNKYLSKRENKDKYMSWLKDKASKESRTHTKNKIFVVCDTIEGKCDFEQITEKVKNFMNYFKEKGYEYLGDDVCELIYIPTKK